MYNKHVCARVCHTFLFLADSRPKSFSPPAHHAVKHPRSSKALHVGSASDGRSSGTGLAHVAWAEMCPNAEKLIEKHRTTWSFPRFSPLLVIFLKNMGPNAAGNRCRWC